MRVREFVGLVITVALLGAAADGTAEESSGGQWFVGNTHTHTNRASPDVVAGWYREHGYHFVVLTDIDRTTPVDGLNALLGAPGRFLVLPGIEISYDDGETVVDVIGVGGEPMAKPESGPTASERLIAASKAIVTAGGLPVIAHPNLTWALGADDLAAAPEPRIFEVWNAEPGMHNRGGGGSPSTEELWDAVLSTGRSLFAVAADDAHDFRGELGPDTAAPGRAWIVVRAAELSERALLEALSAGDFYASTGVFLKEYEVDDEGIRLVLSERNAFPDWLDPAVNPTRYRTTFVGRGGEVLGVDGTLEPSWTFRGDELYVRARIEDSSGNLAWTQPVFPQRRSVDSGVR